jgi:hypothetical protein
MDVLSVCVYKRKQSEYVKGQLEELRAQLATEKQLRVKAESRHSTSADERETDMQVSYDSSKILHVISLLAQAYYQTCVRPTILTMKNGFECMCSCCAHASFLRKCESTYPCIQRYVVCLDKRGQDNIESWIDDKNVYTYMCRCCRSVWQNCVNRIRSWLKHEIRLMSKRTL